MDIKETYFIAVEVEPSPDRASGGRTQLEKYVDSRYFKYGLLVCPGRAEDEKYYEDVGLLTWDDEGRTYYYEPRNIDYSLNYKKEALAQVSIKLLSYLVLKNTKLKELATMYPDKTLTEIVRNLEILPIK